MALWLRRGRRWLKAPALAPYLPPGYLKLFPAEPPGPSWRLSGAVGEYGADSLPEFLQALLSACRRPPGGRYPGLWELVGDRFKPIQDIPPFDPRSLWPPGVELARLRRPPDRWLLTLHVARPKGKLVAAKVERYLASWHTALEELLKACTQ